MKDQYLKESEKNGGVVGIITKAIGSKAVCCGKCIAVGHGREGIVDARIEIAIQVENEI